MKKYGKYFENSSFKRSFERMFNGSVCLIPILLMVTLIFNNTVKHSKGEKGMN